MAAEFVGQSSTISIHLLRQTLRSYMQLLLRRKRHSAPGVYPGGGGGVLPSKRLLGMYRWMGLHFHNWTDYNGVTFLACFSRVTRMGSQIFGIFGIRKFW